MSSSLDYSCNLCNYTSNNKYNYHRHMNLKHSEDPKKFTCDLCDGAYTSLYFLKQHKMKYCTKRLDAQNVAQAALEVANLAHKVAEIAPLVANPTQNVATDNLTEDGIKRCSKCNKQFTRSYHLNRHLKNCKGTTSSLECPNCHIVLKDKYCKYRHMKICSALIVRPNNQTIENVVSTSSKGPTVLDGSGQTAHTISNVLNNVVNHQPVQNINYITFTMDKRERINFSTDHFTPQVIENIIKGAQTYDEYSMNKDIMSRMGDHLFKAITNRCVRKKNRRTLFSEVHVGENKWEEYHDSEIYDKFLTDMTEVFIELVNRNKETIKVSKLFIKRLDDFMELMADKGYCSSDDEERCTMILQSYKELLQRLKVKILNH